MTTRRPCTLRSPPLPTQFWKEQSPSVAAMVGGKPLAGATAFVCQNFTCKAPTRDAGTLEAALREPRGGGGGARAKPTALRGT
jgi:hypothetical protein